MASSQDGAPLFSEGGGGTLRLLVYLTLALVLMVADHRGRHLDEVRRLGAELAGPIYWLAGLPVRVIRGASDAVTERRDLLAENAAMKRQLMLAQARLSRVAAIQDQNERLRRLLDARHRLGLKVQLAELIDVDLDPFRQRIVVDLGERDGVKVGQAAMDAHGVVGQVLETSSRRAVLILVTDASHALPVQFVRSGLRTIAFGTGDAGTLRLPHIPFSADVKVGDELVTSGLGGSFPAGLPVGVVRALTPDDAATFVLALATPSAALTRSGEVLLLHDAPGVLAAPDGSDVEFVGPPEALPVTSGGEAPRAPAPEAPR